MVRSIPLPKSLDSSRMSDVSSQANNPLEYSPAGVSEMTFGSNHSRRSIQRNTGNLLPPSTPTGAESSDLNLPSLGKSVPMTPDRVSTVGQKFEVPMQRTISPQEAVRPSEKSRGVSSMATKRNPAPAISGYDATEESCLLKRLNEDDKSGSQTNSLVVTYAQTTSAWKEASKSKETERMTTMRHAKAILDAHRGFMDSPGRSAGLQTEIDARDSMNESNDSYGINEDGLVSLAGDWPEPKYDRICPEVLKDPIEHLHTLHDCAVRDVKSGRCAEAVQLFEMVVEVQKARHGTLHEDVGAALHNVGVAYLRLEEYYNALQAFEEAVRVRKGALGRDHPQVAVSLVKVGISLLLLRRLEDSLWIFREALSVRKLALGSLHPSNARIYNNIGCVHVEFNELNEARRAFEAALDIQRNTLVNEPNNGQVIFGASTTLQNLGYLYAKRDMHEKSAMVLRESLSVS